MAEISPYSIAFPKKVYSGAGSISQLEDIVAAQNAKKVCVLTDKGVYSSGIVKNPIERLDKLGIEYLLITDIPTEPQELQIKEVYEKVCAFEPKMIISIGGGSVLDTAKLLCAAVPNPAYINDILDLTLIDSPVLPSIAIPTSAGTGAEATANAIVLFPEKDLKIGIVHSEFIPTFVILDPELTVGLPPAMTASTGVDAFCHALESYISLKNNPFSEMLAMKAMELICENIEVAYKDGKNIKARENMQLASFYAGMCLTTSSTVGVHALSYPLGGKYRIAHGLSNAILLPFVMQENIDVIQGKLAKIASFVLKNSSEIPEQELPQAVVDELFAMMKRLGIPDKLTGFGVVVEDLDYLADNALKVTRLLSNNPKVLSREVIRNIYNKLL